MEKQEAEKAKSKTLPGFLYTAFMIANTHTFKNLSALNVPCHLTVQANSLEEYP